MATINKNTFFFHPVETIYAIIADINSYPHFIPLCVDAKIFSENYKRDNLTTVEGYLKLKIGGIQMSFTTLNLNLLNENITMKLQHGTLKQLSGLWDFTALNAQTCKVSFSLTYQSSHSLLNFVASKTSANVAEKIIKAINSRADQLKRMSSLHDQK